VVTASLRPLFETNMERAIVAAVGDPTAPWVDLSFRSEVLNLTDPKFYFNSGVLLINVDRWKNENITDKLFCYLEQLPSSAKLHFPDQDLLNAVLQGRWRQLSRKWNFFETDEAGAPSVDKYDREAVIVHFASGKKPWFKGSTHPARQLYLDHRQNTPFRDLPLKSLTRKRLKLLVRAPLSTLKNLAERLPWPLIRPTRR
jgi:lipopolysaccharide biosynthesis glycosyltransferase